MSVPVPSTPTTPTNPDLREQIPSAIADPGAFVPRAKERGAGGQYESVPQWAARAVGSLVWPLVAEARAEADMHRRTRLRVERVLDEALGAEEKDGTGEGLAADVRLAITRRDEEIERLHAQLASAVVLPEDWREQINEFCRSKQTYTLAEALEQCFARWQVPSVSDQTPATPDEPRRLADALELIEEMHGYVPAYFADKWQINERIAALRSTAPSSIQGDTTPGEVPQ